MIGFLMGTKLNGRRTTVGRGRGVLAVLAAAVLVAACGSSGTTTSNTAAKMATPAGAKENATTGPVCTDWMDTSATPKVVDCAKGARGPGGGRIFYDAVADPDVGSAQPWGRFLEAAPQNWNGALYHCPGELFGSSCGVAPPITANGTSDLGPNGEQNPKKKGDGYKNCGSDSTYYVDGNRTLFPSNAQWLSEEIGHGRANTDALLGVATCTTGKDSAVKKAAEYDGGGLHDWFLPSVLEMDELWNYPGRNAIGGFSNGPFIKYATSSVTTYTTNNETLFYLLECSRDGSTTRMTSVNSDVLFVRPIRAF